ncbi:MAG: TrmH family RNA methyltransferase [Microthrixaceae bacterium]
MEDVVEDADTPGLGEGTRIESAADPRVAEFRHLKRGDLRPGTPANPPTVIIEGHLALLRALTGPLEIRSVLVTPARARSLSDLLGTLPEDVALYVAERPVLEALTGFDVHRGVLASAARPAPVRAADLLEGARRVVGLEGLTDLENVGAAFRNAAALGLDAVLIDGRCADPLSRRCVRVSLGWSTVVPHARLAPGEALLPTLASVGLRAVALSPQQGSVPIDVAVANGVLDDPVALLVGSEGPGLEPGTIEGADHTVCIPMANEVDSLNAATALAVVSAFAASRRGWS